mmetsp:Transcript_13457/g.50061  ORF Transcript_13457/g.50061 Transcript_13457/m.50061 type:complete len:266 (-) Transcript_13457:323-1120(-)
MPLLHQSPALAPSPFRSASANRLAGSTTRPAVCAGRVRGRCFLQLRRAREGREGNQGAGCQCDPPIHPAVDSATAKTSKVEKGDRVSIRAPAQACHPERDHEDRKAAIGDEHLVSRFLVQHLGGEPRRSATAGHREKESDHRRSKEEPPRDEPQGKVQERQAGFAHAVRVRSASFRIHELDRFAARRRLEHQSDPERRQGDDESERALAAHGGFGCGQGGGAGSTREKPTEGPSEAGHRVSEASWRQAAAQKAAPSASRRRGGED